MQAANIPIWPCQPMRVYPSSKIFKATIADAGWRVEAKHDDWRAIIQVGPDGIRAWTRKGNPLPLPGPVLAMLGTERIPVGTVLDGCLIGPRGGVPGYLAFDVPVLGGTRHTGNLDARRRDLESFRIDLVERLPNQAASYEAALAIPGVEGIVLKRADSLYQFGTGPGIETPFWLKVKVAPTYVDGKISPKPPTPHLRALP